MRTEATQTEKNGTGVQRLHRKAEEAEREIHEEQRILATNAWHLARYVIEHENEIARPEGFNAGQFLYWAENYPALRNAEDRIAFVNQYEMLERSAKNVTARTLVATRIHGRGLYHAITGTSVGLYLAFLSVITAAFLLPLLPGVLDPKFSLLAPFCAAGLGTCFYLLRITQEKLKSREFDPVNIPSHLIRLGLGVLAGGMLVIFPELLAPVEASGEKTASALLATKVSISQKTLAFIFGYAVDIFYAVLDKLGGDAKRMHTRG